MKSATKKTISLIFALLFCFIINAQKIAHIHLDSLINSMSETRAAQQVIDKYRKQVETESINMQTDFENKVKDFQDKESTFTASVKQDKIKDLQLLQQRVEDFKNDAYKKLQAKYNEYTAPIMSKARKGIAEFAKENNYTYVLDTSSGNVLYFETSDDIFSAVLKKLEAMPAAKLPSKNADHSTSVPPDSRGATGKG